MAETVELAAQKREGRGSNRASKLRAEGLIPAVVYGHGEATLSVAVARDDLSRTIRLGQRVVDLKTDGQLQKALIREVQWDHLGKELLHVDFYRVSKDERIEVQVKIELRGVAPGSTAGGVLDQPKHELNVECLAIAVPDNIRVVISDLQLGQAIHVKDVALPEGVKALAGPDAVVVQVIAPQAEAEPTLAPTTAEPEVIGRKAGEGEAAEKDKK